MRGEASAAFDYPCSQETVDAVLDPRQDENEHVVVLCTVVRTLCQERAMQPFGKEIEDWYIASLM